MATKTKARPGRAKGARDQGSGGGQEGAERSAAWTEVALLLATLSDQALAAVLPGLRRIIEEAKDLYRLASIVPTPPSAEGGQPVTAHTGPQTAVDFNEFAEAVSFIEFAEAVSFIDELIHDRSDAGYSDVQSCCCTDLATFVWNAGNEAEHAEALLRLLPVTKRVKNRLDAEAEAKRGKAVDDRDTV